jgi:hypothetical protein
VLLTLFFICFSFHYERAALFLSCFRRKSPALSGKYEQGPGPPVPLDGPAISLFRRNPAPKVRNIFHHTICILPFNLSASPTVNFPPHSPHALKTQSPSVLKPPSPNLLLPATSFLLSSYAASGRRNRAGKATRLRLGDGGGGEAGDVAVRGGEGEDGAGEQAQDGGAQPAPPLGRHQDGPQDPFSHGDVAFSVRLGRLFPTDILAPFFFVSFAAEQKQKRRRIVEAAVVPPSPARRSQRLAKLPEVKYAEVYVLFLFHLRCFLPRLKWYTFDFCLFA